jgi:hypothetical protein
MPITDAAADPSGPATEDELWKSATVMVRTDPSRPTLGNYLKHELLPHQKTHVFIVARNPG